MQVSSNFDVTAVPNYRWTVNFTLKCFNCIGKYYDVAIGMLLTIYTERLL